MSDPAELYLLNNATWEVLPPQEERDGIPYATHEGKLELFGHTLRCYRLSNGKAVFHGEDFKRFVTQVFEIEMLVVDEPKP